MEWAIVACRLSNCSIFKVFVITEWKNVVHCIFKFCVFANLPLYMCIILDIRLVGGNVPTEGRVEIIVNGEWGTICDFGWDLNDAHTVCRQLGYHGASEALSGAYFGEGVGNIWIAWVHCPTGTKDHLRQCTYSSPQLRPLGCYHSNDASVRCFIGRRYFTSLLINDHFYTRCFL